MDSEIKEFFKDLAEAAQKYAEFKKLYDQHKEVPPSLQIVIDDYLKTALPSHLAVEAQKCEFLFGAFHNGCEAGGVRVTIKLPFKREEVAEDFVDLLADFKVNVKSDLAEKFSVSAKCFWIETLFKPKFDYD